MGESWVEKVQTDFFVKNSPNGEREVVGEKILKISKKVTKMG
jgi:hypothetical protein